MVCLDAKKSVPVVLLLSVIVGVISYLFYDLATQNRELKQELEKARQEISELKSEATTAAEEAEQPVATQALEPGKEKGAAPKIEKRICLISEAEEVGGDFFLSVDYVQLLTGEAVKKEAIKRGWDPDIEYCIINDNPRTRKFKVCRDLKNGKVKMVSRSDGVVPEGYYLDFGQWFDIYSGMGNEEFCNTVRNAVYWIWVENNEVTKIEQQYFP